MSSLHKQPAVHNCGVACETPQEISAYFSEAGRSLRDLSILGTSCPVLKSADLFFGMLNAFSGDTDTNAL